MRHVQLFIVCDDAREQTARARDLGQIDDIAVTKGGEHVVTVTIVSDDLTVARRLEAIACALLPPEEEPRGTK